MSNRFRLETRPDSVHVADLLLGSGQVHLLKRVTDDPVLASLPGFRSPAREALLREVAGSGHYAFVRLDTHWAGEVVGEVADADAVIKALAWPWGGAPEAPSTDGVSHQAFLDTQLGLYLSSGRHVRLKELNCSLTYSWLLEGTPTPSLNAEYRERLLAQVKEALGEPIVVVEPNYFPLPSSRPGASRLPRTFCSARLQSEPLDPEQTASQLTLCWWEEQLDRPIPAMLAERLAGVDWEASSKDWDFW